MSVWARFEGHGFPSLLTTNVASREPLLASRTAAAALLRVIAEVHRETRFKLLAFVVMPDHIHLVLAVPPHVKVSRVMRLIKGRFARRHNLGSGRAGALWQTRYHERALRSERALVAAIEYVHNNPVRAGMASRAESFFWSSAHPSMRTDLDSYLD
jgi:putative transposase